MPPPSNNQRKRTKRYLVRNSLENPEFQMSTIPQEERSSPASDSLPELIVEREPNRHDDPPEFYEGLERRMKRVYRQLFLGGHGSDGDISSDFEATMASSFQLEIETRKEKAEHDSLRKTGSKISINSDDDYDKSGTHHDKRIDTCETYNEMPIDDFNKFSSTGAHSESYQATDEDILHLQLNDDSRCLTVLDETELKMDNNTFSEDSIQDYHIVSTTMAQIHVPRPERPEMARSGGPISIPGSIQFERAATNEMSIDHSYKFSSTGAHSTSCESHVDSNVPKPERPQMPRSGSPILISRSINFARAVFGTHSDVRHRRQSVNVFLASGGHGSDDVISSELAVHRNMGRSFQLDIRKEKAKRDSVRETQQIISINTSSDDDCDDDKLMDTNEMSIDNSNKFSSTGAHSTSCEAHVDSNVPKPERPQMARSGSPILISRSINFARTVFRRNSVGRHCRQNVNVFLASDKITKTFSSQKSVASSELDNTGDPDNDMKRLLPAGKRIKARPAVDEAVHPKIMRKQTETSQASPELAFEAPTSAKGLQDISTDSNEEESEAEFRED